MVARGWLICSVSTAFPLNLSLSVDAIYSAPDGSCRPLKKGSAKELSDVMNE